MAARGMNSRDDTQFDIFEETHPPQGKLKAPAKRPTVDGRRLWTADKASLIEEYIHRFLMVTKHGVYLDLFAGPQGDENDWAVKRVLQRRRSGSPAMRYYAVCDLDAEKAARLRALGESSSVRFRVYHGDANEMIGPMLEEAPIGPNTACFCLIDQRTFECHWSTVRAIAEFKSAGTRIEVFYFLAQAWFDRALQSHTDTQKLTAWWGGPGYADFGRRDPVRRAYAFCDRFQKELGYAYAQPFSILKEGEGTRTMYFMIHASDHRRARELMADAYQAVPATTGRPSTREMKLPLFQDRTIPTGRTPGHDERSPVATNPNPAMGDELP